MNKFEDLKMNKYEDLKMNKYAGILESLGLKEKEKTGNPFNDQYLKDHPYLGTLATVPMLAGLPGVVGGLTAAHTMTRNKLSDNDIAIKNKVADYIKKNHPELYLDLDSLIPGGAYMPEGLPKGMAKLRPGIHLHNNSSAEILAHEYGHYLNWNKSNNPLTKLRSKINIPARTLAQNQVIPAAGVMAAFGGDYDEDTRSNILKATAGASALNHLPIVLEEIEATRKGLNLLKKQLGHTPKLKLPMLGLGSYLLGAGGATAAPLLADYFYNN